jgi:hypothetical protein
MGITNCYTLRNDTGGGGAVNVKTAVSIQKPLFDRVEALARKMKISRSRLYAQALEEYILKHENRQLLERINAAYQDGPDEDEIKHLKATRITQRKQAEGEW